MKRQLLIVTILITFIFIYVSCSKILPKLPEDDSILDGPLEGLSAEQNRLFLRGDVAFNDEIFNQANGLGPLFVANSCGTCHAGDGKGHPFTTLTRFGQRDTTGNTFLHLGGPQLQHRSIIGFQSEKFLQVPPSPVLHLLLTPAWVSLKPFRMLPCWHWQTNTMQTEMAYPAGPIGSPFHLTP